MPPNSTIHVPEMITKTLVCIDVIKDFEISGRLLNLYIPTVKTFASVKQLLDIMDGFFDEINFPQAVYTAREFSEKKTYIRHKRTTDFVRYHDESLFETERGMSATFMIQVRHRWNASWQGNLNWLEAAEGAAAERFHSTLEMLRFILRSLEKCGL